MAVFVRTNGKKKRAEENSNGYHISDNRDR